MNNDLISRKALLEAYDKAHQGPPGGARKLIEEAPGVDAVEVVRCRDCKYIYFNKAYNSSLCRNQNGLTSHLKADYFCSYGERKEK